MLDALDCQYSGYTMTSVMCQYLNSYFPNIYEYSCDLMHLVSYHSSPDASGTASRSRSSSAARRPALSSPSRPRRSCQLLMDRQERVKRAGSGGVRRSIDRGFPERPLATMEAHRHSSGTHKSVRRHQPCAWPHGRLHSNQGI